jgi:hypothetical protein
MNIVVDANIVKGYFDIAVKGGETALTSSPIEIFDNMPDSQVIYIDDSGQIEYEWRKVCEGEWFDGWLPRLFQEDKVREIPCKTCSMLKRRLREIGFPVNTKDFWYIKTAKSAVDIADMISLITEDMHFFEPSLCGGSSNTRERIILDGSTRLTRYLRDQEGIQIVCVMNYLQSHNI